MQSESVSLRWPIKRAAIPFAMHPPLLCSRQYMACCCPTRLQTLLCVCLHSSERAGHWHCVFPAHNVAAGRRAWRGAPPELLAPSCSLLAWHRRHRCSCTRAAAEITARAHLQLTHKYPPPSGHAGHEQHCTLPLRPPAPRPAGACKWIP